MARMGSVTPDSEVRLIRRNTMAVIKQKIVPHLWFDREAKEAANFYCSLFPDSRITKHYYAARHADGRLRCRVVHNVGPKRRCTRRPPPLSFTRCCRLPLQ